MSRTPTQFALPGSAVASRCVYPASCQQRIFLLAGPTPIQSQFPDFAGRNGTSHDAPARVRQPCFDKKPRMRGRVDMSIFTILFIVLLLAWILGFGVFHVAGALIHILLVLGGYCAGHSLC